MDHNRLILTNSRYAGVLTASTPEQQAQALQAARYAGKNNTKYAGRLIDIINTYNLKKYDQKKKIMKWIDITIAVLAILSACWIIYKATR